MTPHRLFRPPAAYLLLCALGCLGWSAPAPSVAQENFPTAVVNLDEVYAKYDKHRERLAPIREKFQELEKSIQLRQVEIETLAGQLRTTAPGTPDFQKRQQQLNRLQVELQQFVVKGREELQQREMKAVVESRSEVNEEIRALAKARGIRLVLRKHPEPAVGQNPNDFARGLNDAVVFADGLDITADIVKALAARATRTDELDQAPQP